MKIISIDVGIINLAYCCMDDKKNIFEWKKIRVIDEPETCYLQTCKAKPIYWCKHMEKSIHWCAKHGKIYNVLKTFDNIENNLTKIMPYKTINCKNIPLDQLRASLIYKLDVEILPLIIKHDIDYVLIESQPALKNGQMKSIADIIYAWFYIRGINDIGTVKSIHLIYPGNKLKKYVDELGTGDESYNDRKSKSEYVTSEYLKIANKNMYEYLQTFKKKDDLCDALLQGFYWIDKMTVENEKKSRVKKIRTNTN